MEATTKTLLQDGDINKYQEELIFDPYNFKNSEITQTQVSEILKNMEYPIKCIISNYMLRLLSIGLM